MAARQFSLVVFRALAVIAAFTGLNFVFATVGTFLYTSPDPSSLARIASVAIICVYILIAAFLWTFAERLAVHESEEKLTVKAGNWVVRLVFTALGLVIMTFSLNSMSSVIVEIFYPEVLRRDKPLIYVDIGVGILKFLIGLTIFLTYRFDKPAAFEAAQAVEPPIED